MKGKKGKSGKPVIKEQIFKIPNPGSDEALYQGCICPVLDNYHGEGWFSYGKHQFWVAIDCPLHTPEIGKKGSK